MQRDVAGTLVRYNAGVGYNRGGRRRDRTNAVGALVGERLRALGFDRKVREHTAPLIWAELVGPQVAAATEVERVADGVLWVSCRSAMWSHELTFHKADILRRLNTRLAAPRDTSPVIADIRFSNHGLRNKEKAEKPPPLHPTRDEIEDVALSPAELAEIEQGVAVIGDESLRARLRRARVADAKLRTWRMENGWAPCPSCHDLAPPTFPYDGTVSCPHCRVARHLGR
jgi:predicted nucleic acid-binding Zn ribbon protein